MDSKLRNSVCLFLFLLPLSAQGSDGDAYKKTQKYANSKTPGGKVLLSALDNLKRKTIIKGSCWDWVNHVFQEAGYPSANRQRVYRTKLKGPYADTALVKSGDWVMYKNLSYGNVPHSGIFVYWVDKKKELGMVLSYRGGGSSSPGRFRVYDLSCLYGINRGK